ncbi:MAG: DUF433 domain-containing protein, partial [Solimonas sp.]
RAPDVDGLVGLAGRAHGSVNFAHAARSIAIELDRQSALSGRAPPMCDSTLPMCYIPDSRCQPMSGRPMTSLPEPLITISPESLSGAPIFTGTRVPVQALFDYIEAGDPLDEFLDDFPNVSREHAVAMLEMARQAAIAEASMAAAE